MPATASGSIRVRLAPSPTGHTHIGLIRTGLFNWLFARQNGGEFLLRIEDTDKERSKKEYEQEIIDSLAWLGLGWDGEITRQSERLDVYRKYLEALLESKQAYYCYCKKEDLESERQSLAAEGLAPKYSGHCRDLNSSPNGKKPEVIRFKVPEAEIDFKDLIRGKVRFDASLLGDIVIAKNLDTPLYNFAVVIDDAEMKISHVIRGEDHISNTPKQILLARALGFEAPIFAHIPLILAPDRSKLSKRTHQTSVLEYRKKGYLPEAILNFLALLGWHPKEEKEIFTLSELVKEFDITRVQKAGAIFNEEKLNWLNKEHIKNLSAAEIFKRIEPELKSQSINAAESFVMKVIEITKERMKTLRDFTELSQFFFIEPEYDRQLLKWGDQSLPDVKIILAKAVDAFKEIQDDDFNKEKINEVILALIGDGRRGEFFWPIRVALSGLVASPDPAVIAETLGKNEVVARLNKAIEKIDEE